MTTMNWSTYSRDRDYPFTNVGTVFQDSGGMRTAGVNRYDQSYSYFTQSSTAYSDEGHRRLQTERPDQVYISPMTSRPAVEHVTYGYPRPFRKNPNVFNGNGGLNYLPGYGSARWRQSQQSYPEPRATGPSSQQPIEQHRDQRYVSGLAGRGLLAVPEQATATSWNRPTPVQTLTETAVRNNQPHWTGATQSPACENLRTPNFPVWPLGSRRQSNPLIIRTLVQAPRPVGRASLPSDTVAETPSLKNTNAHTEKGILPAHGAAPRRKVRATRRKKVKAINAPEKGEGSCELLKKLISAPPCTQSQLSAKMASVIATKLEEVPHELDNTKQNGGSPCVFESMKLPVKIPGENNSNSICALSNQNSREKDRDQLSSSNVMDGDQLSSSKDTDMAHLSSSVEMYRAHLFSSMEIDRAQLSSPKLTDSAHLTSSNETDGAQLLTPMATARANVLAAIGSLKHQVSLSKETDRAQVPPSNETDRAQVPPSNETDKAQVITSNKTDRAQIISSNETDRVQIISSNESDRAQVISSNETDRVQVSPSKITDIMNILLSNETHSVQLLSSKDIDTAIVLSKQTDSSKEVSSEETDRVQVFSTETDTSQVLQSKETDSSQLISPKETAVAQVLPLKDITKSNALSSNTSTESHKPQVSSPSDILSSKAFLLFNPATPISFITSSLEPISPKLETVKSECVAETNSSFYHPRDANSSVCNHYLNSESESVHTPESMSLEDSNTASLLGLEDYETLNKLEPEHSTGRQGLPPNFLIENPRDSEPNSDLKEEFVTGHQFYTCTACKDSFGKEILLWVHLVIIHSADEFLACPYCNLSVTKGMYIAHMKIAHFKTESQLFGCGGLLNAWQCTYLAETITELTRHMGLNHSTECEFRCVKCNYFSASIRSYIVHAKTCKPLGDAIVKSESPSSINSSWHTMSQLSKLVDALHQNSVSTNCQGIQPTCTNHQAKDESSLQKQSTIEFSSPPTPPKSPCTPILWPSKRMRSVCIRMVPMDAAEVEVIKKLKKDYLGTIDKSVRGSEATRLALAKLKNRRDSIQGNVSISLKFDTKCDGIKSLNAAKSDTVTKGKDRKEGKPFRCVYCGKGELCLDDVVRHNKRRHSKSKMEWKLSDVRLTFARDGTLLDGDFKKLKESRYLCSMCSFRSDRRSSVTKHMISEHSQIWITGRVIKLRKSGKTHLPDARKSRSEVKSYACNQCSYKTTTFFHFRLHMAHHNAHQDRLVPVVCEKVAFRCGTCGYFAVDSADFRAHEEIHLQERRFLCGYCSHDDDTEEKVSTHIRSSHGSPILMYDRQILYNEMAKEPQKMIKIFPKVLLRRLDGKKYTKSG